MIGFLFIGLTVPLFGFVVDQAWSQGNMLASVSFVILVGIAGVVLMLGGLEPYPPQVKIIKSAPWFQYLACVLQPFVLSQDARLRASLSLEGQAGRVINKGALLFFDLLCQQMTYVIDFRWFWGVYGLF